mgnify:CR=1 FL=1
MIKIITTSLLVILFLLSGKIIQGLKKLIGLVISNFMKLLSFFGIKIKTKEKVIKISQEFKETYKDIKIVKLSNKNIKDESSIDWIWLSVLIVAGLLILLNMKFIWGTNPISDWLYSIIKNLKLVKSETDMNTLYTATFFSVLSFSASKVLQRWKETKQNRIERKQQKIKLQAIEIMSTRELLDEAKKKDEQVKKDLQ